jgi:hypothetical protein
VRHVDADALVSLKCGMSAYGTLVTCARRGSVSGLETFSDIGASAAHVAE